MALGARARAARAFLTGLVVLPVGALLLQADLGPLVEAFHEQRVEEGALAVWRRQASAVTVEECLRLGRECEGKLVYWHFWRHSAGTFAGSQSQRVRFTNDKQAPSSDWNAGGYDALAKVAHVKPDQVELIFLGTPSAPYGGTTWTRKFGAEKSR